MKQKKFGLAFLIFLLALFSCLDSSDSDFERQKVSANHQSGASHQAQKSFSQSANSSSPKNPSPQAGGTADQATAIAQASKDLKSEDYVVLRRAIFAISDNISAPNILMVVKPLIDVATDASGMVDAYTRVLSVPVLLRIGILNSQTGPGREAIQVVIDLLHNSSSDLVRGSCAYALGITDYQPALSDLEQALTDPSAYVQEESCQALLSITDDNYSSELCNSQGAQSFFAGVDSRAETGGLINFADPALDWLRSHLLIPLKIEERE